MLCNRITHQVRLFTILALALVAAGCGEGDGPTPIVDPTPPVEEAYTISSGIKETSDGETEEVKI